MSHYSTQSSSAAPRSILRSNGRTSTKRPLVWNESNLELNESEKVPRMKVDEPKTPYHHKQRRFEYETNTSNDSVNQNHVNMSDVDGISNEQHDWEWEDEPLNHEEEEDHTLETLPMDDSNIIQQTSSQSTIVPNQLDGETDNDDVNNDVNNDVNDDVNDDEDDIESSVHSTQFAAMRSAHYKMGDLLRSHDIDNDEDES